MAAAPPPQATSAAPLKETVSTRAAAKGNTKHATPAETKTASSTPEPAASEPMTLPIAQTKPDVREAARKGTSVVALVAPPTRNKAEAEATLARMRDLVRPMQADPELMQGQLFESPEGWRPAVWPFASRIEAQLINATLVARGLHTKAVDF